jgi:curved DNA-binding protein CbpA
MSEEETYYDILGVDPDSSESDIKKKYNELSKKYSGKIFNKFVKTIVKK